MADFCGGIEIIWTPAAAPNVVHLIDVCLCGSVARDGLQSAELTQSIRIIVNDHRELPRPHTRAALLSSEQHCAKILINPAHQTDRSLAALLSDYTKNRCFENMSGIRVQLK